VPDGERASTLQTEDRAAWDAAVAAFQKAHGIRIIRQTFSSVSGVEVEAVPVSRCFGARNRWFPCHPDLARALGNAGDGPAFGGASCLYVRHHSSVGRCHACGHRHFRVNVIAVAAVAAVLLLATVIGVAK